MIETSLNNNFYLDENYILKRNFANCVDICKARDNTPHPVASHWQNSLPPKMLHFTSNILDFAVNYPARCSNPAMNKENAFPQTQNQTSVTTAIIQSNREGFQENSPSLPSFPAAPTPQH